MASSVRSDLLFARAISLEELQRNSNAILAMLLEEDPRRYTASVVGEISPINPKLLSQAEVASGGINWMFVNVRITADIKSYRDEYQARLEKVLDSVTASNERIKCDFGKYSFPQGFVYPATGLSSLSVRQSAFIDVKYGARMIDISPPAGAEHIYRKLFIPNNTVFSAGRNPPQYGATVSWAMASMTRPFNGYNVMLIGVDHNGYSTLRGYAIAPAFFQTFEKMIQKRQNEDRNNSGALVVQLQLMGKDQSTVKKFEYPLPRGYWFDKAAYAGTSENAPANQRLTIMPIGLSPNYVDSMVVQQKKVGRGVLKTQNIVSIFSTISTALVTFKFPMNAEELRNVRQIRVKTSVSE